MWVLSSAHCTDVRLYTLRIKVGTRTTSARELSHCWTSLWCFVLKETQVGFVLSKPWTKAKSHQGVAILSGLLKSLFDTFWSGPRCPRCLQWESPSLVWASVKWASATCFFAQSFSFLYHRGQLKQKVLEEMAPGQLHLLLNTFRWKKNFFFYFDQMFICCTQLIFLRLYVH